MNEPLVLRGSDHRLSQLFETLTAEDGESYPPFRWQKRLLKRLVDADIPQVVDVPTGLGKTSVMALWLIAMAEGAQLPRRLVYVVDRRAVVDQATRYAERLKTNLTTNLAEKLHIEPDAGGLPISTLRGGFADNRDWLEDPSKPAIVVGTIDMIGSRLLFEGYGVSRRMRPYHAGLLGVDALVLLDEAHLCPPFEAMFRQVAGQRDGELGSAGVSGWPLPPFHLMSLSATGRDAHEIPPTAAFRLEPQDCEEAEVKRRLQSKKRMRINELDDTSVLAEHMANRAVELSKGDGSPSRVVVFCDRRKDAMEVKDRIAKAFRAKRGTSERKVDCVMELLVGERRVRERIKLESWLNRHGFLGEAKLPAEMPTFLVATSAGEVGVDLNADHMVCDLVAYERMVQRLGRVNRRGGEGRRALIDVFWAPPTLKANANKAAKDEHARKLDVLEKRRSALVLLPSGEDGRRDASPSAIGEVRSTHGAIVKAATSRQPLHPALTRPLVDAWSMTSFKQHEGRPEVAPWLRGWEEDEEPQTLVVWRRHLPFERRGEEESSAPAEVVAEFFRQAPIQATEKLEAASSRAFDWLLKRGVRFTKARDDAEPAIRPWEIVAVVMNQAGECIESARLSELQYLAKSAGNFSDKRELRERNRSKDKWVRRTLPGGLLVVDARLGGLRDGMLDEKCNSKATAADGDEGWVQGPEAPSSDASRPLIKFRVEVVSSQGDEEGLGQSQETEEWRCVWKRGTYFDAGGVPERGLAVLNWHDAAADEDAKAVLAQPQLLCEHAEQAASHARRIARRLRLPDELIYALTEAARLHDDGKAAACWQRAMNAPKDDQGRPYAKTKGGGDPRLLGGYRHEFGSLLKAERKELPGSTRDLILHLIAAHHGYARPLIRHHGCEEGPPSQMESKAGEVALRFARLQRQYGPWGLAWLEALLRAADQSASREWSRSGAGRNRG